LAGGDIPRALAFTSVITDKLPAIRSMTMQGNHQVVGLGGIKTGWQNLDIALFGSIRFRLEDNLVWLAGKKG
jgi:hypothetical protein